MKLFRYCFVFPVVLWLSILEGHSQQIPQFSQYIFNPVFINPAYAGYKQQLYLQSYYRKQWTGVTGSPETLAVSADSYLADKKLGLGAQLMTDRLGAQRTTAAYSNLSYHLQLTRSKFLSFGAGVGLVNSILDGAMLNPGNDSDPNVPAGKDQTFYPDLKLGLFLYDDVFYVGISGDQLISSMFDFDNGSTIIEPVQHMYLTGGYHLDLTYNLALIPSLMYMDDFKAPGRLDINANLVYNDRFWFGLGYRTAVHVPGREIQDDLKTSTAVLAMAQVFVGESLRFGYVYDHNLTGFSVRNFTTHDISIAYLFPPKKVRMVSPRFF